MHYIPAYGGEERKNRVGRGLKRRKGGAEIVREREGSGKGERESMSTFHTTASLAPHTHIDTRSPTLLVLHVLS